MSSYPNSLNRTVFQFYFKDYYPEFIVLTFKNFTCWNKWHILFWEPITTISENFVIFGYQHLPSITKNFFVSKVHLIRKSKCSCWISYHCCTTSFNKAANQVLRRFKSCLRRVGDSWWWGSLAFSLVPGWEPCSRLGTMLNAFRWSTIPQKQFIIIRLRLYSHRLQPQRHSQNHRKHLRRGTLQQRLMASSC